MSLPTINVVNPTSFSLDVSLAVDLAMGVLVVDLLNLSVLSLVSLPTLSFLVVSQPWISCLGYSKSHESTYQSTLITIFKM